MIAVLVESEELDGLKPIILNNAFLNTLSV